MSALCQPYVSPMSALCHSYASVSAIEAMSALCQPYVSPLVARAALLGFSDAGEPRRFRGLPLPLKQ